jgi:hypothetical protein
MPFNAALDYGEYVPFSGAACWIAFDDFHHLIGIENLIAYVRYFEENQTHSPPFSVSNADDSEWIVRNLDFVLSCSEAFHKLARAEGQLRNALMDEKLEAWGRHCHEQGSAADTAWAPIPSALWRHRCTRRIGNTLIYNEGRSRYFDLIVLRSRMLDNWPSQAGPIDNSTPALRNNGHPTTFIDFLIYMRAKLNITDENQPLKKVIVHALRNEPFTKEFDVRSTMLGYLATCLRTPEARHGASFKRPNQQKR